MPTPEGRFCRTRTVADEHIDWLGHVNNVVWLSFVVELAHAHSESVGLDLDAYRKIGSAWAVHRHELDYHGAAFAGDVIEEETWIEEMRGARCVRCSRFVRPADGAVLLEARTTWAFTDLQNGRPRRFPAEVSDRFRVAERAAP